MRNVAILGTGIMGSAMARRLAQREFTVRAWNRTADRLRPLIGVGVLPTAGIEDAVRDADAVITMVSTGDVVASMADTFLPVMPEDAVWLQTSTVGGRWSERLREMAVRAGRAMLDCPVFGSAQPAEEGTLTLTVSGNDEALRAARPVLDALGTRIVHAGTGTDASQVKLIVNAWLTASVVAMADLLHACDRLGVDPAHVLDVLDDGPLAMRYALDKVGGMRAHDYPPGFPVELAGKDIGLLIGELGRRTPLAAVLDEALGAAIRAGHAREDIAAVAEVR